jgi:hypothetical protein
MRYSLLNLRLQWSKIKFQFRGLWVVYSANFDGCQSICGGSFEQKLCHKMHALSVRYKCQHKRRPTNPFPLSHKPLFGNTRTTNTVKEILYSEKSFIRTSVTKQSDRKIGAYYRIEC